MKFYKSTYLLVIGVLVLILTNCSQHKSSEQIVVEYQNIFNQHNVDALMKFYSDDIVFSIPNMRMELSGKDALRGVAEYDSVLHTIMEISNISVLSDTVFCSLYETNDWMKTVGISSANYPNTKLVIHAKMITYFETNLSDSSVQDFRTVMGSFIPWGMKSYPIEMDSLMPDGNFTFNRSNGIRFLELSKKWKEVTINIDK